MRTVAIVSLVSVIRSQNDVRNFSIYRPVNDNVYYVVKNIIQFLPLALFFSLSSVTGGFSMDPRIDPSKSVIFRFNLV